MIQSLWEAIEERYRFYSKYSFSVDSSVFPYNGAFKFNLNLEQKRTLDFKRKWDTSGTKESSTIRIHLCVFYNSSFSTRSRTRAPGKVEKLGGLGRPGILGEREELRGSRGNRGTRRTRRTGGIRRTRRVRRTRE